MARSFAQDDVRERRGVLHGFYNVLDLFIMDEERLQKLVETTGRLIQDNKVIIFCDNQNVSTQVTQYLRENLNQYIGDQQEVNVCEHKMPTENDGSDWEKFLSDEKYPILVCGNIAEEGLNLQSGKKCIIHFFQIWVSSVDIMECCNCFDIIFCH